MPASMVLDVHVRAEAGTLSFPFLLEPDFQACSIISQGLVELGSGDRCRGEIVQDFFCLLGSLLEAGVHGDTVVGAAADSESR